MEYFGIFSRLCLLRTGLSLPLAAQNPNSESEILGQAQEISADSRTPPPASQMKYSRKPQNIDTL